VQADATFGELYGSAEAKLASAEELIASMDAAGVDVSVALGFAWADVETCRLHNDYLIEAARQSGGRIVAFATLPLADGAAAVETEMRRCVAGGALGFGELRPDNLGFDLNGADGEALARVASELDAVLLFHVSEPVGHAYPGKEGGSLAGFYGFIRAHPGVKVIGAHWAGGLPFFATMPEVKDAMASTRVDTAATSLLYDETIYGRVTKLTGAESVLFGSDYPLLSQSRSRQRIEEAGLDAATRDLVLGGNAAALLGLA
jgi:hypothetical protein